MGCPVDAKVTYLLFPAHILRSRRWPIASWCWGWHFCLLAWRVFRLIKPNGGSGCRLPRWGLLATSHVAISHNFTSRHCISPSLTMIHVLTDPRVGSPCTSKSLHSKWLTIVPQALASCRVFVELWSGCPRHSVSVTRSKVSKFPETSETSSKAARPTGEQGKVRQTLFTLFSLYF